MSQGPLQFCPCFSSWWRPQAPHDSRQGTHMSTVSRSVTQQTAMEPLLRAGCSQPQKLGLLTTVSDLPWLLTAFQRGTSIAGKPSCAKPSFWPYLPNIVCSSPPRLLAATWTPQALPATRPSASAPSLRGLSDPDCLETPCSCARAPRAQARHLLQPWKVKGAPWCSSCLSLLFPTALFVPAMG